MRISKLLLKKNVGMLGVAVFFLGILARAETRTEFLANQLATSDDPRIRVQAALGLGTSVDAGAIMPLCKGIQDSNDTVRSAVVAAAVKLGNQNMIPCLQERASLEESSKLKAQIAKAIQLLLVSEEQIGVATKVYVAIGATNNKTKRNSGELDELVRASVANKLHSFSGYTIAPKNITIANEKRKLSGKKIKSYFLQTTVDSPVYQGDQLVITVHVVMSTYPGKDLKGEFVPKLKQSGVFGIDKASEDELIRMAIDRALDSFEKVVASSN